MYWDFHGTQLMTRLGSISVNITPKVEKEQVGAGLEKDTVNQLDEIVMTR